MSQAVAEILEWLRNHMDLSPAHRTADLIEDLITQRDEAISKGLDRAIQDEIDHPPRSIMT